MREEELKEKLVKILEYALETDNEAMLFKLARVLESRGQFIIKLREILGDKLIK